MRGIVMNAQRADVSVVILARTQGAMLPMCLAHLEVQTYPAARFEIVIVDEGCSAEASDVIRRHIAGAPVRAKFIQRGKTGLIAARNQALRSVSGRWLLFLNENLLAGAHLLEAHVRSQEQHGGRAMVIGRVAPHPQTPAEAASFGPDDCSEEAEHASWADCRLDNLSINRQSMLDAGGFDEGFPFPAVEDIELAWRLRAQGEAILFAEDAYAYFWLPGTFRERAERCYFEGYCLPTLMAKTNAEDVRARYQTRPNPLQTALDRMAAAMCRRLRFIYAHGDRRWRGLCGRALRAELLRGYRDARNGRRPRGSP
jgi:glycosyltransferase involved in cell wall biosynthesis